MLYFTSSHLPRLFKVNLFCKVQRLASYVFKIFTSTNFGLFNLAVVPHFASTRTSEVCKPHQLLEAESPPLYSHSSCLLCPIDDGCETSSG